MENGTVMLKFSIEEIKHGGTNPCFKPVEPFLLFLFLYVFP